MKKITKPISFFIEGENIVVSNPCTIPIEMIEEVLKEPRKKNLVTACFVFKIQFPKELKRRQTTSKTIRR